VFVHTEGPSLGTARLRSARGVSPRRGGTAAITTLACAALVSACGSSKGSSSSPSNLDTARVARSIEGAVLEKRKLHATVTCPERVPQEAGRTFECVATIRATKPPHAVTRTPFVVTIQNNRGYVTYVGR
jgi:hypothetical protein